MTRPPDKRSGPEAVRVPYLANFEFSYAAGRFATRFLTDLREHTRLSGARCDGCGAVLVPPRPVCGLCSSRTGDWVEVGPGGTVTGYTVVEVPFIDPMTGYERPIPYGFAFVRLDGADTNIYHFLEENRHDRLRVGMQVEAVFRERADRVGSMSDILHFRSVDGGGDHG